MSTESYIIRVYRREAEAERSLVGTIEIVETQEKKSFVNFDELRDILKAGDENANHDLPGADDKRQGRKIK